MNTCDRIAASAGTETHVTVDLGSGERTTMIVYLPDDEPIGDLWQTCTTLIASLGFERFAVVTIAFRGTRPESAMERMRRTLAGKLGSVVQIGGA